VRFWLRSLAVGAAVGLVVGFAVGGTLGRVCMRILFLARRDTLGLEAMGGIVGELTAPGTLFVCVFGAALGLVIGLVYVLGRTLLPRRARWREWLFVAVASGSVFGLLVRVDRDDFRLFPVTLGLLLILASVVLTADPVPYLVERLAPDRERRPGPVAHGAVALGVTGAIAYAALGVFAVYS
jgi:hypothetical protein